ncbi:MAG TPA: dTMP kinase [Candidatus Saccharimonadales bacterium]|jgi:dTMP kinase|nr:dTMP kinase [Candidatus Saccharimonadales bacterium]
MRQTYGKTLPGMRLENLTGKLIVIEGTDGAGRTTQINLIKPWLEELGHAVLDTGITRSRLAGDGIRRAKEGNNLGHVTQSLFYATDFIDRLENDIIPALRAGFIVLTDRYIYSLMARAIVRGMDASWIRSIYNVALKPDAVFYLRIGVDQLLPRVVFSGGFDYWESGMDLFQGHDMYDSFCSYQTILLKEFDHLAEEYKFEIVDASANAEDVCNHLKKKILAILKPDETQPAVSNPQAYLIETLMQKAVVNLLAKRNGQAQLSESNIDLPPFIPYSTEGNGKNAH